MTRSRGFREINLTDLEIDALKIPGIPESWGCVVTRHMLRVPARYYDQVLTLLSRVD